MNLARLGEESVERFGEHPALAFEGRVLTNVDQQHAASRFAHALRRLGVDVGDRVAVLLPNCPEVLQAYAGILKAGGVIVPVIFFLAPEEVRRILDHAEARVLVTSPDLAWKAEGWTRILDDADRALGPREVGEVAVRGPNVMLGYHRMPEETAQVLRGGWLRTGDMGRLDPDGFLYLVERKKDLIIRGGLNVYPREVEEVFYAHPAVAEAAVVGRPDTVMGEEVLAHVVLRPAASATAGELIAFCETRLARFKCPRDVRFADALPKSPLGKVLTSRLR